MLTNITLYSLANKQEQARLYSQLINLGCCDIISIDGDKPIRRRTFYECQNSVVILQLKYVENLRTRIVDIVQNFRSRKVLGLFQSSEGQWDREIVNLCKEVAVWPCSENELMVRLNRVSALNQSREQFGKNICVRMNLIGKTEVFMNVLNNIEKISICDAPVFINGETGTGKEVVARAIHYFGNRSEHPFVAVNCGALQDSLVENEMFGHVKGAFTDAKEAQVGLIAQAEGGTLFLDEIETLTIKGQATLLRFLQDLEFRPVGSGKTRTANVRIITASNEPLETLVKNKMFRQDLYYRINILNLSIPPLRQRREDIKLLAEHFMQKFQDVYDSQVREFDRQTLEGMQNYSWPGNVRELENLLHREFLLSDEPIIKIEQFCDLAQDRRLKSYDRRHRKLFKRTFKEAKEQIISQFEGEYLNYVMRLASGNISEAARIAGKERRSFSRLLKKYMIDYHTSI